MMPHVSIRIRTNVLISYYTSPLPPLSTTITPITNHQSVPAIPIYMYLPTYQQNKKRGCEKMRLKTSGFTASLVFSGHFFK